MTNGEKHILTPDIPPVETTRPALARASFENPLPVLTIPPVHPMETTSFL